MLAQPAQNTPLPPTFRELQPTARKTPTPAGKKFPAVLAQGEAVRLLLAADRDAYQALLAEKLPAEKAAAWGLIWAAVEDSEFSATIESMAQQLAAAPTKALVRTRQAMHAAPTHTLEQQLSFEGSFMRELGWSPDYAEGVAAFMEKRAPNFTGE